MVGQLIGHGPIRPNGRIQVLIESDALDVRNDAVRRLWDPRVTVLVSEGGMERLAMIDRIKFAAGDCGQLLARLIIENDETEVDLVPIFRSAIVPARLQHFDLQDPDEAITSQRSRLPDPASDCTHPGDLAGGVDAKP